MGDIEDGMAKMRQYWANQRELTKRPMKHNIPPPQETVAETVSRPFIIKEVPVYYQQPQPIPYQQPVQTQHPVRKTVRFNYPAFGFSMLMIAGIMGYLVYTTPSMQIELASLTQKIPQSMLLLVAITFLLSCFMMLFIRRQ